MDREQLGELWSDPRHYKGSVYRCKEDPRVIVPKRDRGTGWTLNFAHARAWWVLASMPLMVVLPVAIALLIWPQTGPGVVGACLLGGVLVVIECLWLNPRAN
jgi:Family of unknown function (DUF5808)